MSKNDSVGEVQRTAPGDANHAGNGAASDDSSSSQGSPVVLLSEQALFILACGIFEGEGSISRSSYSKSVTLDLTSTDFDILETVKIAFGCGKISTKPHGSVYSTRDNSEHSLEELLGWKPAWRWRVGNWDSVEPLLKRMRPFMGQRRRAKIDEVLADPPAAHGLSNFGNRSMIPGKYCSHGHLLTKETIYVYTTSYGDIKRNCWICKKEQAAEYRAKRDKARS